MIVKCIITIMSITIPVLNVHFGPLMQLSCASNHLQTFNKINKVYYKTVLVTYITRSRHF